MESDSGWRPGQDPDARHGGKDGLITKANANLDVISSFVDNNSLIAFLAEDKDTLSNTSVCLKIIDPRVLSLDSENQAKFAKKLVKTLDDEGVAYDIGSYRDAPAGLRIWTVHEGQHGPHDVHGLPRGQC